MAKILIIEDSSFARKAIVKMAKADGHEVLEADEGSVGLELAASQSPDCITLDLIMPGIDGMKVLQYLQRKALNIPTIVLTADVQEDTRKQCLELGAVDVLNKPPKEEELRMAIDKAIKKEEVTL